MVKTKEVKLGVTRLLRFQHYLKLSPLLTDKVGRLLNDVVGLGGCRLQKSQEIKKLHLKMQTVSIIIFQFLKNTHFFFFNLQRRKLFSFKTRGEKFVTNKHRHHRRGIKMQHTVHQEQRQFCYRNIFMPSTLMLIVMTLILKIHMGWKSVEQEMVHYSFIIGRLVCFQ